MVPLPIDPYISGIVDSDSLNRTVVATPGSGKTTRLPPAVSACVPGRVLCVEPRRLACIAAATRVAHERGMRLGEDVGYHVRLEKKCTPQTKLCFVTTGMLLQYLCADPFLEEVSVVIFDEFHERSLEADLSLAMVRYLQRELRDDLGIVVMSATLESAEIVRYLGKCEEFSIDAPVYPLEVRYIPCTPGMHFSDYSDFLLSALRTVASECGGDCLIFLPGLGDIHAAIDLATPEFGVKFELLACHASLSLDAQKTILNEDSSRRRFIFSTNVAESSLTVPGVRSVIDVGLAKRKFFDSVSGLSRLETQRISRASADQRAGRAARLGPGLCIRLWSEVSHRSLDAQTSPEMERLDLSRAFLQTAAWGLEQPENMEFLSSPAPGRIRDARQLLERLGAVSEQGLTSSGRRMVCLPVEPRLARWLIAAKSFGCLEDAALLAAYLSEAPYRRAQRDAWPGPDLYVDFLRLKRSIRHPEMGYLRRIAADILESAKEHEKKGNSDKTVSGEHMEAREALCRSMLCAYPDRLAQPRPSRGEKLSASDPRRLVMPVYACMSGNRGVVIREAQTLKDAAFFICADLDLVRGRERAANTVVKAFEVDPKWIPWQEGVIARYEPDKDRVVVARSVHFDIFTLRETFLHDAVYDELARRTLLNAALETPGAVLNFDTSSWRQFSARIEFVRQLNPDVDIPVFDESWGRMQLPRMVRSASSFADLKSRDLATLAMSSLDYRIAGLLRAQAPERIVLQNGYEVPVDYTGTPPIVRVKIQKAFGTHELPRVGGGRVPVIMHLCAPNGQPAQMTQDLENFWNHTYADVRRLLRGRYPKHSWPEIPE